MNIYIHGLLIPILLFILVAYGIFFKDWAKKNYEIGFIPGPRNLRAYIWTMRVSVILMLAFLIFIYTQALIGN
jgi:hypothetical protein